MLAASRRAVVRGDAAAAAPWPGTSRCRPGAAARSCRRVPAPATTTPTATSIDSRTPGRPRSARPARSAISRARRSACAIGGGAGRAGTGDRRQQQRELVAAEPGRAGRPRGPGRRAARRPCAAPRRRRAWPRVSLTSLKWLMSSSSSATGWSRSSCRSAASPSASSAARLTSPVSGSCTASYGDRARQPARSSRWVAASCSAAASASPKAAHARLVAGARAGPGAANRDPQLADRRGADRQRPVSVVLAGSGWPGGRVSPVDAADRAASPR